jgi:transposase
MTKSEVKEVLDRVLSWPADRQEDAAALLKLIEQHDRSPLGLSEEQAAELRERLAEKNPATLTLAELDERLRRLGV